MDNKLYCDFCGKTQDEVLILFEGPSSNICNDCIDVYVEIIMERKRKG